MNKLTTNFKRTILNNAKKIYTMNYLVLFITSILYGVYILTLNISQQMNFQNILKSSPYTSIMFIVILLNLLIGYALWIKKAEILENSQKSKSSVLILAICQLLVGNIFSFITFIATFITLKEEDSDTSSKGNPLLSITVTAASIYLLSFLLILRLTFIK